MSPSQLDGAQADPELNHRLAKHLKGCCMGGSLHAFACCPSTMDIAVDLARQGAGEGTLVFAARQELGRGRQGRRWESPEGGAYFSLILKPLRPAAEVPQLSLVAGLAVAEVIRELTKRSPAIRWPNDVLIDSKKVAGLLVEAREGAVILGVGINVTADLTQLPDTAMSLAALGVSADPCEVAAAVCRHIDRWYDVWTAKGFAPIRDALRPCLSHIGGIVRLTTGTEQIEGQAVDLDEHGRLVVRLDSGMLRPFDAGEVTLLR